MAAAPPHDFCASPRIDPAICTLLSWDEASEFVAHFFHDNNPMFIPGTKKSQKEKPSHAELRENGLVTLFIGSLPFSITDDQLRRAVAFGLAFHATNSALPPGAPPLLEFVRKMDTHSLGSNRHPPYSHMVVPLVAQEFCIEALNHRMFLGMEGVFVPTPTTDAATIQKLGDTFRDSHKEHKGRRGKPHADGEMEGSSDTAASSDAQTPTTPLGIALPPFLMTCTVAKAKESKDQPVSPTVVLHTHAFPPTH